MEPNALQVLQNVIAALDKVTVTGLDNMDRILGCAQALEKLVREEATKQMKDAKKEPKKGEKVNGG